MRRIWLFALTLPLFLKAPILHAQVGLDGSMYDDYSAFDSDPVQLDEEVSRYFGRFFQTNVLLGTGLFTGELGQSNTAGFNFGVRFVFYFDKLWGGELGAGYYSHRSFYNSENAGPNIDIELDTVMIPLTLGIRYAFDRDNLPRGISLMNPYLAFNGIIAFRAEGVRGTPKTDGISDNSVKQKFAQGSVINSSAFGVNFGGGFEFDVYKNKVFLGLDLRYHILFWPDADILVGTLGRNGNYFTAMGMVSYNY